MTSGEMTEQLNTRINAIARCRPLLAGDISAILNDHQERGISAKDFTVEDGSRGEPTLRLGNVYVHSRFDPVREAQKRVARLAGELDNADRYAADGYIADGYVLVGLGLGYLAQALSEKTGNETHPVIAVVFSSDLLQELLHLRSESWWCTSGPDRIVPAWVPDALPVILRDSNVFRPHQLTLDAFALHQPELHRRVMEVIHHAKERNQVNRNTLRRFGRLWVRNSIRNTAIGGSYPGIDDLENSFPAVPALICGAGPSLDDIHPYLADFSSRGIIIAVDTAIPVLQRWGVTPHFAVVSDPQYWNTRHLDQAQPTESVLVAEPATHPRSLRLWQGPVVVSASLFPLGNFIDRQFGRTLKLGAGGSVATSAWDLARMLGSRDIGMIGVDLGFPDNLTHCANSFFENRLRQHAHRLAPAEHGMTRYLHGASPRPVPSASGGTVLSDRRMDVYRSWFSEQNRRHPSIRTTLLSPRGSAIDGCDFKEPRHWIEGHPRTKNLSSRLAPYWAAQRTKTPSRARTVLEALRAQIQAVEDVVNAGLRLCDELGASAAPELERLDEIDARLTSTESRDVAGFLATDALEQEIGTRPKSVSEAIEQARSIYSALADSCRYHIGYIEAFL